MSKINPNAVKEQSRQLKFSIATDDLSLFKEIWPSLSKTDVADELLDLALKNGGLKIASWCASSEGPAFKTKHVLSALIEAIKSGNVKRLDALMPSYDSFCCDEQGNNALMWAAAFGSIEAVQKLLGQGANACHANEDGDHALFDAIRSEHSAVVAMLVPLSDLKHKNNDGDTALMEAVTFDDIEVVKLLMDGSDVNDTDVYGNNALMLAAMSCNQKAVELLMPLGSWAQKNKDGQTFLDLVKSNFEPFFIQQVTDYKTMRDEKDVLSAATMRERPQKSKRLKGSGL